jgi:hypothetical protein
LLLPYRSFSVDRPIRHSSSVMIQKRTTTCVSFQPDFEVVVQRRHLQGGALRRNVSSCT